MRHRSSLSCSEVRPAETGAWILGPFRPQYRVEQALTGQIVISRPPTGVIRLDVTELKVPSHPSLTLCIEVPSQTSDCEKLARII